MQYAGYHKDRIPVSPEDKSMNCGKIGNTLTEENKNHGK